MAWTAETDRLVRGLRRTLAGIVDEQVRDLTAAWARGFDEVAADLHDAILDLAATAGAGERITRSQLIRSSRLMQALAIMAEELDTLAGQAGVRISGDLQALVLAAGQAQAHIIASQLPASEVDRLTAGWDRVDARQIDAIVRSSTEQITARTKPLSRDAMTVVRRELIRGTAVGANPRETARRIVARAGRGFNGGLTRALAIARTEGLDASRRAADLGRVANRDVLKGWSWHCELSARTCPACIAMDGQVFPAGTPGPDDHVNGRCTAVPVTKSWADLGITGVEEPPSVRVDGPTWFGQQDAATQKAILGPARYDAWEDGRYPVEQWGAMRSNTGWRDSLQVTSAPRSVGGASRVA